MQPQTFVFFGIIGSGKGTQVKFLMDFLKTKGSRECVYVGTGEIFRKILESSPESNPEARAVKEILSAGKLMPDEITNKLVAEKIASELSEEKHGVFDGYPRTVAQSEFFEKQMVTLKRSNIKIIYIKISEEEAIRRNMLRGRHDDTKEGIEKRIEEYNNKVIPSMDYFKDKAGYQILTINGEQSREDVYQEIINALNF